MAASYFVCRLRLAFGRKTLLSRQVAFIPTAYCMRANARHDWCSPPAPFGDGHRHAGGRRWAGPFLSTWYIQAGDGCQTCTVNVYRTAILSAVFIGRMKAGKKIPSPVRIADVLSAGEGIRGLERAGVFENNNLFPLQDSALSFAMRQPDIWYLFSIYSL